MFWRRFTIRITQSEFLNKIHLGKLNNFSYSLFSLTVIKDYCLSFIVKEDNFQEIVMSPEFAALEKVLIVEIIRKRLNPGRPPTDLRNEKSIGTTLESDMEIFLKSGGKEFCDINLLLGDTVIPAHKSILAARCSYFQGLFRSFPPPENTVKVRDGLRKTPWTWRIIINLLF